MIIIGVDTAIRCTGYGIIDAKSINDISIVDCGIIKNTAKMPHSECLRRIAGGIRELVKTYSPTIASIENAFYGKNVKTSMILSLARGAAIATLAEEGVIVYEYSPREAKKAVVGHGNASKDQIATIISSTLGITIKDIPRDATDAIGLALCHGQLALRPELSILLPKPV